MAGGTGAEYYFGYNYIENDLTLQDFRSRDQLFEHTSIALSFFRTHLKFWEMENLDPLIGNTNYDNTDFCFGKEGETYAIYLQDGGTVDLDLGTSNTNTYSVKWFNPATGGALLDGSITSVQGTGSVNLGTAPYSPSKDWVVLVQVPEPFQATKFESFCVLDSSDAAAVKALLVQLGIQTTTSNCDENNTGCTTPFANAGLDQVIGCGQTSVTLDGSGSDQGTYAWTGPNNFTSSANSPSVSNAGTYYLTVTTTVGCSGIDSVVVTQGSGQAPVADAGSDLQLNCNSPSVTLDGSGSGSGTYSWTGPNGFTSSVQSPSVSLAGTYTLTVIGSGGCQASDDVVVTSDPNQPSVDAGTDQTINCLVSSVTLDGSNSDPGTYSWTGPNGFSSSSVSPTVTVAGSYTLEVTLGNGCSATDIVTVVNDTNAPTADAGSDQIIGCNNNSVFLDGTGTDPGSVSWTGPNGFSSVAINPTVSVAGVYTITVTGSNGCSDSDDVTVTEDITLPIVDAGKDVDIDCSNGAAILDGSDSDPGTYSWTGPNGFTSSAISPSVTVSGTYTLTVTGANGCVDSDVVVVSDCAVSCNGNAVTHFVLIDADTDLPILDPIPNGAIIDISVLGDQFNFEAITTECGTIVKSVEIDLVGADNASKTENKAPWTLFGDNSGNYYAWTASIGSYTLTGVPYSSKSGAGTAGTSHTVSFTIVDNSGSGCTTPQVSAGSDVILACGSNSVTIDGSTSDPGTYSWSGPNGFTSSAVSPSVSSTGTYTLMVTVAGGCSDSDVVVVNADPNQPNTDAGPIQTIDCNNPTVNLDGSASDPGTYSWTGPNGFTSSAISPSVSVAGVYTLQVTVGGCSGTDQVVVADDTSIPNADAGSDKTLDCSTNTITLDGSNSDPGTYSWTGPNGFTSSIQNPTVSESGIFILTVTSSNGCSDSDNVVVTDCSVQCSGNAVTHFVLINSATDLPVLDPIPDGAIIDIGTYGNQLNIEAMTTVCGTVVKSVEIDLVGAMNASKTENNAPWTLFGDNSGNYFNWTPALGSYTLTGVPYSAKSGGGTAGTAKTINFTIIDSSSPAPGAMPGQSPSSGSSGIGESLKNPTLEVMPNPFQNRKFNVNLQGDFGKTLDIKVFSINGQLIYQEKRPFSNEFTIDLTPKGITDGVYQLRVNNKTKLIQSKSSQ